MKEPFSDSSVLLSLLFTILIIFTLIFTFGGPKESPLDPSIQWKDAPMNNTNLLKL